MPYVREGIIPDSNSKHETGAVEGMFYICYKVVPLQQNAYCLERITICKLNFCFMVDLTTLLETQTIQHST